MGTPYIQKKTSFLQNASDQGGAKDDLDDERGDSLTSNTIINAPQQVSAGLSLQKKYEKGKKGAKGLAPTEMEAGINLWLGPAVCRRK